MLPGQKQLLDVRCLASLLEGSPSGHGSGFGAHLLADVRRQLTPSGFRVLDGILVKAILAFEALDELFRLFFGFFEPLMMFFTESLTLRKTSLDRLKFLCDEVFVGLLRTVFEGVAVDGEKDFVHRCLLNTPFVRKRKTDAEGASFFMAVVVTCRLVAKPTAIMKDRASDDLNRGHDDMEKFLKKPP